jgi:Cu(I)/Ag(I) efflux system membrane fusion protein
MLMNNKKIALALVAAVLIAVGGYGLYSMGMIKGMNMRTPVAEAGKADAATDKKVLYWHDPMVPGQKFDKPGKSPFMDMQLVPVYAAEAGDDGKVIISPRVQQNLGIRTAQVTRANLTPTIKAVGSIVYNERDVAVVQARSNGFVERLHVRAPLDSVKKGQALADLYVPDWVAAQEEYLSVRLMRGPGADVFLDGARQRMRLVGMNDSQIRQVEASGKLQTRTTITSPVSGVVAELIVREGMTVMSGAPLFRINGLSTIWVNVNISENMAALVIPGNLVEASTPSLPGIVFKGKVSALLPEVNPSTRTLNARVELANPEQRLVPGMFSTINFALAARKNVLTIPTEALIQTGTRSVVMVAQGNGKFLPVDVEIGAESDGQTEIRKGLEAGQKVVVSGQFLIDSEASLKGTATRMSGMGDMPVADDGKDKGAGPTHRGSGKIEKIAKDEITLSHGPIPSLQWGAMTMVFKLPTAGLPKNVAVGDSVSFEIRPIKEGMFEIVTIEPSGAAPMPNPKEAASTGSMKPGKSGNIKDSLKTGDMAMPAKPAGAAK